jgi:hypothetical protein
LLRSYNKLKNISSSTYKLVSPSSVSLPGVLIYARHLICSRVYNATCHIIALDTFRQALVSHAYAHLALNVAYAKDMVLLIKLYDHFIHHYLLSRYKKECRMPGSVKAADTEPKPTYWAGLSISIGPSPQKPSPAQHITTDQTGL